MLRKNEHCRVSGDGAYIVNICVDDEEREKKNITHARVTNSDAIEEKGWYEFGWVIEQDGKLIAFRALDDALGDIDTRFISPQTARQLAEALSMAADAIEAR